MSKKMEVNLKIDPQFDKPPRVYVRKLAGDFEEVLGIKDFDRLEDLGGRGELTFTLGSPQEPALRKILTEPSDKYLDVKMVFPIGLVMKFSGFLKNFSDNNLTIAISTPIEPDMDDMPNMIPQ